MGRISLDMRRAISLRTWLATAVLGAILSTTIALAAGAREASGAAGRSAAVRCPQRAPGALPRPRRPAARRMLAPGGARMLLLCRYAGLNARPQLGLIATRRVRKASLVRTLVAAFDRLPALHGPVACPADDGSQILAVLTYARGPAVPVSVGLKGCELAANGALVRTAARIRHRHAAGRWLVRRLEHLLAAASQP